MNSLFQTPAVAGLFPITQASLGARGVQWKSTRTLFLLALPERKLFVVLVVHAQQNQINGRLGKAISHVGHLLNQGNPFSLEAVTGGGVAALELSWAHIEGIDFRWPLHEDGRLVLEARAITKRCFATMEDVRHYYDWHPAAPPSGRAAVLGGLGQRLKADAAVAQQAPRVVQTSGSRGGGTDWLSRGAGLCSSAAASFSGGPAAPKPAAAQPQGATHVQGPHSPLRRGSDGSALPSIDTADSPFTFAPGPPRGSPLRRGSDGSPPPAAGDAASARLRTTSARQLQQRRRSDACGVPASTSAPLLHVPSSALLTSSGGPSSNGPLEPTTPPLLSLTKSLPHPAAVGAHRLRTGSPLAGAWPPPVGAAPHGLGIAFGGEGRASSPALPIPGAAFHAVRAVSPATGDGGSAASVGNNGELKQLSGDIGLLPQSGGVAAAPTGCVGVAHVRLCSSSLPQLMAPLPVRCEAGGPAAAPAYDVCPTCRRPAADEAGMWDAEGARWAGSEPVRCGVAPCPPAAPRPARHAALGLSESGAPPRANRRAPSPSQSFGGAPTTSSRPLALSHSASSSSAGGGAGSGAGIGRVYSTTQSDGGGAAGGAVAGSAPGWLGSGANSRGVRCRAASTDGSGRPAAIPGPGRWTVVSAEYCGHRTLVVGFQDPLLPCMLRGFVKSEMRLLRLYESGLPAWCVFLPSYGLPYRPWLRRVTWLLFIALSVVSMACGFYDLYKNVPYLKAIVASVASRLKLPGGQLLEWLEEHTTLRLSILLTYLAGKSPLFFSIFTALRNVLQRGGQLLAPLLQPLATALQPLASPLLSALSATQLATQSILSGAASLFGPPAHWLWDGGGATARAVGAAAAALWAALLAPLHLFMALWSWLSGAGGAAVHTVVETVWPTLQTVGQTAAASGAALRLAAGPAIAAGTAAVKASGGAAAAAGGGSGGLWQVCLEAAEVVRGIPFQLFKAARAVLNFFLHVALVVSQHRASLWLQARPAWWRVCAVAAWRPRRLSGGGGDGAGGDEAAEEEEEEEEGGKEEDEDEEGEGEQEEEGEGDEEGDEEQEEQGAVAGDGGGTGLAALASPGNGDGPQAQAARDRSGLRHRALTRRDEG